MTYDEKAAGFVALCVLYLVLNFISLSLMGFVSRESISVAVLYALPVGAGIWLFMTARFSFGFLVGFYFYAVIAGFIWITFFSRFDYNPVVAALSAAISIVLFLIPSLAAVGAAPAFGRMSTRSMDRLSIAALICCAGILLWNGYFGWALVGIHEAAEKRATLERPAIVNYVTSSATGAVLPFLFAYFALKKQRLFAAASLLLLGFFYPVTLTKTVLFSPPWLAFLYVLFKTFEPRMATVLSLLIPVAFGLLIREFASVSGLFGTLADGVFDYVNVRMIAIPSIALDYYSDFFSSHPNTYFCQITVVKKLFGCIYTKPLWTMFGERYGVGSLNASLFATEGIASVGVYWAPVSAFFCGVAVLLCNAASRHLSPMLVVVSSAVVVQALLNVPLSIVPLSNGLLVLLVLWHLAPADGP